jgi:ATP-dependent helicase/nuclease subunit B
MPMQSVISALLAKFEHAQVIITANRRLALYLSQQYARYKNQQGHSIWQTPDIIPYQAWLCRNHQVALDKHLIEPKLLLTESQELNVWEQIISQAHHDKPLLQTQSAASEVKQAWKLLWEWQCSLNHPSFVASEDSKVFQNWARQFEHYLKQKNWLDCSRLPECLYEVFTENSSLIPSNILWIGFLEFTPQQQKLLNLFSEYKCQSIHIYPDGTPTSIERVAYSDQTAELRHMARWAKKLSEPAKNRIGCIISDLGTRRAEIIRIFSEIFAPELLLDPSHANTHLPFNISAGLSLNQYPLIHAALTALQLNQPFIPATTLSYLLRSPFFGQPAELFIHIRLQSYLNQFGEHHLSRAHLLKWIQSQTLKCQWLTNLTKLLTELTEQPLQQLPSLWAQSFSKQLALLGWPGERGLNSEEYQLLQKWQELLSEFASFDHMIPTLSSAKAWQKMQNMLAMTIFQPESAESNVQILGTLEAVGQQFTHLWIMGLHDRNWPTKPAPNPFLPLSLQREYQLPQASTARETDFCTRLLAHYYQSSQFVTLSYPQNDAEQTLRPSKLIAHVPLAQHSDLPQVEDIQLARLIHSYAALESIELSSAPPVAQGKIVQGGTGIFKSQAACAFKAFAEYRLGAKTIDSLEIGLAATERGTLLHHCLEIIWQELGTQQRLQALTEEQCLTLIDQAITDALRLLQKQRDGILSARLQQLETQRLTKLLLAWLALEKQRAPFEVIALEQRTEVTVGGIPLILKIDRIDKLANGEYAIIDYKTGKTKISWDDDHITEPQLPLYCISSSYPIAAITLAQVRNDEMKFHGIAHSEGLLPQVKAHDNWHSLQDNWQQLLEKIAGEFLAGNAAIAPKDKKTCEFCNLELVCRIKE